MTNKQIDVDGWSKWLEEHGTIRSKLRGANSPVGCAKRKEAHQSSDSLKAAKQTK
ncbi:hypothetical protein R2103_12225 [Nitrosomonas sp. Is24]|uniref:hypothetical protein n=1 Tax=Nitrosomonas sp. Is24 TaxID=3080533 RepID=UPI00294AECB1|nr:hypothetical protein [Nitrosomonas sp. Is24]MDV6342532.1 hypothetical protein [Nitrosomonas sp. Is24]